MAHVDPDKLAGAVDRMRLLTGRAKLLERQQAHAGVTRRADGEWEEHKHPRAKDGKFGSGGASASGGDKSAGPSDEKQESGGAGEAKPDKPSGAGPGGEQKAAGGPKKNQQTGGDKPAAKASEKSGGEGASGNSGFGRVHPDHFSAAHFAYSHDDATASAEGVLKHFAPDVAKQVEEYKAKAMAATPTAKTYRDDRGNYTPERRRLHEDIMFNGWTDKDGKQHPGILSEERIKAATPAPGEKPTFTILGGRGGSGKSKFEHGESQVYDKSKAIVLDSDEIKKALPEYEGWNANQVHDESGDVFDAITAQAADMGLNLVHDATMKTPKKAVDLVNGMKDRGYGIEAHYMHLPRQVAAKRAVERFLGKTRRLVPPEVVLSNVENEAAFDDVKKLADKWSFWDNNVAQGQEPRLISRKE